MKNNTMNDENQSHNMNLDSTVTAAAATIEDEAAANVKAANPWSWVPSAYYIQAVPNIIVQATSVVMLTNLGVSIEETTIYTSLLYLPWALKPLWSPFIDILKTKRWWALLMQSFIICALLLIAFALPHANFLPWVIAALAIMAVSTATYEMSTDGMYLINLNESQQSFFVGIRSTFFRFGWVTGQGFLVLLAGWLATHADGVVTFLNANNINFKFLQFKGELSNFKLAWTLTFLITALLLSLLLIYNYLRFPKDTIFVSKKNLGVKGLFREFFESILSFFKKDNIAVSICFLLLFRLGEGQITKIVPIFLLEPLSKGGMGLSTGEQGFVYGTIGIICLVIGGILGGIAINRKGLKYWMPWMILSLTLPYIGFVYLAMTLNNSIILISMIVGIKQFMYGFSFTAYVMYMVMISQGTYRTVHYALCSACMAMSLLLPGLVSGYIQSVFGYTWFFIIAIVCSVPTLILYPYLKIPSTFAKAK